MNLLKTSFWSALSTSIRILAGMVTTKIMATYVGPVGIALLGNFNNITNILTTFSNGAISSGIIKYISEYTTEEEKRNVVAHSIKITLACSMIIGIFILLLSESLAKLAFGDNEFRSIFIVFGVTLFFFGLNTTLTAILNGYRKIKYMIITSMCGSILSVILAFFITIKFGLYGALINASIAQILIFIVNIGFASRLKLFDLKMISAPNEKSMLYKLFKYATMSIVSVLVVPTSAFIIRRYIYVHFTPSEAGYIQGVWSISAAYLAIVTTTLSIYYLPTLSGIKSNLGLRAEIIKGYKFILPMAIIGGLGIFVFRDLIIYVLYTPEFLPMKKFFTFQIIGDTLKIASWILAFLMVAKAMTRLYIITEIIFAATNIFFSFLFMSKFGSIGVMYGYSFNYFIYLIFLLIIFHKLLFLPIRNQR